MGNKNQGGYGQFRSILEGKQVIVTRYLKALELGKQLSDLDDRMCCHHCDIPACCNVDHLYWGTDADNMEDMSRRFYSNKTPGITRHVQKRIEYWRVQVTRNGVRKQAHLRCDKHSLQDAMKVREAFLQQLLDELKEAA